MRVCVLKTSFANVDGRLLYGFIYLSPRLQMSLRKKTTTEHQYKFLKNKRHARYLRNTSKIKHFLVEIWSFHTLK